MNHPQVVDHYRTAHAIAIRRRSGEGDTEQLRQAFVHYRALFADLLETSAAEAGPEADDMRRPVAEAAEAQEPGTTKTGERGPGDATPSTAPAVESEQPAEPARRA